MSPPSLSFPGSPPTAQTELCCLQLSAPGVHPFRVPSLLSLSRRPQPDVDVDAASFVSISAAQPPPPLQAVFTLQRFHPVLYLLYFWGTLSHLQTRKQLLWLLFEGLVSST